LKIESTLLRASLFLTARALKDYYDSKHTEVEGGWLQLAVPESLRSRAADALVRAEGMLREPDGSGR